MLTPWNVALIVFLVLAARTIIMNMKLRERANEIAKTYCERRGLQFLDGTVALESIRMVRGANRWGLRRTYRFDYTSHATDRHRGALLLLGEQLESFIVREDLISPTLGEN
ncbi:MAG: DUF3301 domain-containing protein [Pseudomonadota bacterium]|nr:DUF3301 domain-containing protein [Pseudomonadota bacterium]